MRTSSAGSTLARQGALESVRNQEAPLDRVDADQDSVATSPLTHSPHYAETKVNTHMRAASYVRDNQSDQSIAIKTLDAVRAAIVAERRGNR